MNLKGKKLLILVGASKADEIKRFADKEGVILFCAGKPLDDQVKEICEESHEFDIMDKAKLADLITTHNIDGVFCGGTESVIRSTIDVCEKLGKFFYSSSETWDRASNKATFKSYCRKFEIPVVPEYDVAELFQLGEKAADRYPIVLKPVDASGSRGVTLCNSYAELKECYDNAESFSGSKRVIAEKYIVGSEFVVYYTIDNGEMQLASACDRFNKDGSNGINPLPDGFLYPSEHLALFKEKYDRKIRQLLPALGIKNGVAGIQAFAVNGDLVFFEMGYRLGGTAQYRYTTAINGVTNMEMLMRYSLTGDMGSRLYPRENADFSKVCFTLTMLSQAGTVGKIEGIDAVRAMPEVIFVEEHYGVGDTISASKTLAQMIFWIFITADDKTKLKETICKIQETVKVTDKDGKTMLTTPFDVDRL